MEDRISEVLRKMRKDRKIIAVALFGSSLKGKGRDIDLCVFLDKKYSTLEMARKQLELLKVSGRGMDIQIFQHLPIYIRIRILKEGKIVFCNNSDLLYGIAFNTIKEFGFYKKLYEMYMERIENG